VTRTTGSAYDLSYHTVVRTILVSPGSALFPRVKCRLPRRKQICPADNLVFSADRLLDCVNQDALRCFHQQPMQHRCQAKY
jgi:hypothetical protein